MELQYIHLHLRVSLGPAGLLMALRHKKFNNLVDRTGEAGEILEKVSTNLNRHDAAGHHHVIREDRAIKCVLS